MIMCNSISYRSKNIHFWCILEQSAVVWHSSLTLKNRNEIERVQKSAVKIILGNKYTEYKDALKILRLETLFERRNRLSLKFATKSIKHEKAKHLFPLNEKQKHLRNSEKFKVNFASTDRYQNSTIPFLQNLLNIEEKKKNDFIQTCAHK